METIDTELLIHLVRIKPYLYSKGDKRYKDLIVKENAWKEIGEALNLTPTLCEKLWKSTKDRYLRERKKKKSIASGSGAKESTWPWYNEMAFLDGLVSERRRTVSNVKTTSQQQLLLQEVLPDDDLDQEIENAETFGDSICGEYLESAQDFEGLIDLEIPNDAGTANITAQLTEAPEKAASRKRKSNDKNIDLEILETIKSLNPGNNEESNFGALVAHELSNIKNLQKRKKMKRQIMNIIYLDSD